jgi:prepilin-type N-terminal cleavage/methylation domain-containing protein
MPEQHNQSGMTLVEILVAMVMMGIIITGIYNLFRVHNLMAAKQEETTMMQQELLTSLADISDEIRMCGFSRSKTSPFGLNASATNATSIYCTREISFSNNSTNIIGYRLDNQKQILVYIPTTDTWEPAASNISDLRFTYYDDEGNTIEPNATNLSDVRIVEINATAIPSPERSGLKIHSRNMHTRIWMRNLGLN